MLASLAVLFFGWPLFVAIGIFILIVGALFEEDWWFRGFIFLAIPFGLLYAAGYITVPDWRELVIYVLGYFAVGIVWSFYKWIVFVRDLKRDVNNFIAKSPSHGFTINREYNRVEWSSMTTKQRYETLWDDYLVTSKYFNFLESEEVKNGKLSPHLSTWQNRGRVISWIAYWPFSVINYVFERLLKDIVDLIIDSLKGMYNALAGYIMKDVKI